MQDVTDALTLKETAPRKTVALVYAGIGLALGLLVFGK